MRSREEKAVARPGNYVRSVLSISRVKFRSREAPKRENRRRVVDEIGKGKAGLLFRLIVLLSFAIVQCLVFVCLLCSRHQPSKERVCDPGFLIQEICDAIDPLP